VTSPRISAVLVPAPNATDGTSSIHSARKPDAGLAGDPVCAQTLWGTVKQVKASEVAAN